MIKISDKIRTLIDEAKQHINIPLHQFEKDYLLTMILRELVKRDDNIIFKGGTCLSKAYKDIERFSEDIDITYLASYSKERKEYGVSGKQRIMINNLIETITKNLDFEVENDIKDSKKKKMNYANKRKEFRIKYDSIFGKMNIIKIDSSYITPTKEYNVKMIQPILCEILKIDIDENNKNEELETLTKFSIKVEKKEQIIADKFFALCKHLMIGNYKNYSRHIYDIHKVFNNKNINIEDVKKYIKEVESYEKINALINVQNGKEVNKFELKNVLLDVCNSKEYEADFMLNLKNDLLFTVEKDVVDFNTSVNTIKFLIKDGIFDNIEYYFTPYDIVE